ncbi:hypothetical protein KQH81_10870 [Clostridium cadaveris]|uniref:hypothetical protein n=1 Tax=Clostridium TaxID=1485 RepID=UPI001E2EF4FC|nr:hypothetical protein [Clostridium cadaveris]MDM8312827.1 hypothetical protein [Clostridium cadaveris]MDU4953487.1 hypothetical protein [Clostridium sp.]UFH63856.1 hypothetical protein KQH81_10870 [Clostridium cadaveris]
MEDKKEIIDVESTPVEENKPVLEKGNYIIEVISNGEVIKKFVAANAEINISKLADGGLTVDLK